MMQRLIEYINLYGAQSKYDYRGNCEPYNNKSVLLGNPRMASYEEMVNLKDKSTGDQEKLVGPFDFVTVYSGIDPMEKSRVLVKKIVKVPIEYGKYGQ